MKKILLLTLAFAIIACKEEPKDYVTLSGKITDKSSDSIVVRSRTYSKTIQVKSDGTFKDTLKVEAGVYNLYDGNESTSIFLKNGFDINLTLDTKQFDESITYSGFGAEHSNFLAKQSLMQEKLLDLEVLGKLNMKGLEEKLAEVKISLSEFYLANKNIDTTIINSLTRQLDPMLNSYKNYLAESITLKDELPPGTPSPVFEGYENYNGSKTSLSDLKGKYVYIVVWATWSGLSRQQIPFLQKVEEKKHCLKKFSSYTLRDAEIRIK